MSLEFDYHQLFCSWAYLLEHVRFGDLSTNCKQKLSVNLQLLPDIVVQAYNPSTWEAETGLWVQCHPGCIVSSKPAWVWNSLWFEKSTLNSKYKYASYHISRKWIFPLYLLPEFLKIFTATPQKSSSVSLLDSWFR